MSEPEQNNKKGWGRRVGAALLWTVLVNVAFYICVFKGFTFEWWTEYVKWHTYVLGFVVGGLTITDIVIGRGKEKP